MKHGLDPATKTTPQRMDDGQLRQRRGEVDRLLHIATPKLDQLFGLVGHSGCMVLLTDAEGVVLDQRCADADEQVFQKWGLWQGADWSEAAQGTNGIGTCLAEQRQLTIHLDEHFFTRNAAMSCMGAPIYGPDGSTLGALDVSSARSDQTETFNRLISAMVVQTARHIETDAFQAAFPRARILFADNDSADTAMLLAVDQDDLVIGATRSARKALGLGNCGPIAPVPASDLLHRDDDKLTGFEKAERAVVVRALARAGGNASKAAKALGIGRATLYRRMKRLGIGENQDGLSHR